MPHTPGTLDILLRWEVPGPLLGYFPSSDMQMSNHYAWHSGFFLFVKFKQHDVISVMGQCGILWK